MIFVRESRVNDVSLFEFVIPLKSSYCWYEGSTVGSTRGSFVTMVLVGKLTKIGRLLTSVSVGFTPRLRGGCNLGSHEILTLSIIYH